MRILSKRRVQTKKAAKAAVCKKDNNKILHTHSENQEKKGIWWMPWRLEAKKDVALCEKLRGDESNQ